MLKSMSPIDALLRENGGRQKCYIDTGPILERDFAAVAGLSWQGKSTMCLNERLGTWFFIGVILTSLKLNRIYPPRIGVVVAPVASMSAPLAQSPNPTN